MLRKLWICLLAFTLLMVSCKRGRTEVETDQQDSTWVEDSLLPDSLAEVEEEMDEAVDENRVDGSFDDFIFTFVHSHHLQEQRIHFPLPYTRADGSHANMACRRELGSFDFLSGDYYTVLYGSMRELEMLHDETDSVVNVDRIDLHAGITRTYSFSHIKGKWQMVSVQDHHFADDVLSDFLRFYASFSSDSTFQAHSLAPMLHVSIHDTDDELSVIDGTIDASQWTSFCPEVPAGIISNIRYSQHYTPQRMVMQKCGMGTGLQEVFTFCRDANGWKLKSYED